MGNICKLPGVEQVGLDIPEGHDSSEGEIRTILAVLASRNKLTGAQVMTLIDQIGDDIVIILYGLDGTPISLQRRRSLWMLVAIHDSILCLTVPRDFLSDVKFSKKEEVRTRAYAYFQAYKTSLEIANGYAKAANPHGFYKEIPNTLIAAKRLHDLGVLPKDIWGPGEDATFMDRANEIASTIQIGIRTMYLQRTPELDILLKPYKLRLVK